MQVLTVDCAKLAKIGRNPYDIERVSSKPVKLRPFYRGAFECGGEFWLCHGCHAGGIEAAYGVAHLKLGDVGRRGIAVVWAYAQADVAAEKRPAGGVG